MLTTIVPQECIADDARAVERWISDETESLAGEIFATTYGLDWAGAWRQAIELLPDLLIYANLWDASAAPLVVFALEVDRIA